MTVGAGTLLSALALVAAPARVAAPSSRAPASEASEGPSRAEGTRPWQLDAQVVAGFWGMGHHSDPADGTGEFPAQASLTLGGSVALSWRPCTWFGLGAAPRVLRVRFGGSSRYAVMVPALAYLALPLDSRGQEVQMFGQYGWGALWDREPPARVGHEVGFGVGYRSRPLLGSGRLTGHVGIVGDVSSRWSVVSLPEVSLGMSWALGARD